MNLLKRIRLYLCNCLLKTFPIVGIIGKICPVSSTLTAAVFWLCKGSVIPSFLIRSLLNDLMLRYYFLIVIVNLVFGWKIPPFFKRREDPRKLCFPKRLLVINLHGDFRMLYKSFFLILTCKGISQVTLGITGWEILRALIEWFYYHLDVGSS